MFLIELLGSAISGKATCRDGKPRLVQGRVSCAMRKEIRSTKPRQTWRSTKFKTKKTFSDFGFGISDFFARSAREVPLSPELIEGLDPESNRGA